MIVDDWKQWLEKNRIDQECVSFLSAEWTMEDMINALLDSPILLKALEELWPPPFVPVNRFPVSREMLDHIYQNAE